MSLSSKFFSDNRSARQVLEEACVRKLYNSSFITARSLSRPGLFKTVWRITTPDGTELISEGTGPSIHTAEEIAAVQMLPEVLTSRELLTSTSFWNDLMQGENTTKRNTDIRVNHDSDILSDTDDLEISGTDPIGHLITVSRHIKAPLPLYEFKDRMGPGNRRIFTATCKFEGVSKTARRYKKKDAQKVAAFRVLRKLQDSSESSSMCTTESGSIGIDLLDTPPPSPRSRVEYNDFPYEEITNSTNHCLPEIPPAFDFLLDLFQDPVTILEKMCELLQARVKFITNEMLGKVVYCQVIVMRGGTFRPGEFRKHTRAGMGGDWAAAQCQAALKMLKHLKVVMTKDVC